jgi:uncharacterized membrane protein YeaQ/YmgE (transglycosylase-associated protein family)
MIGLICVGFIVGWLILFFLRRFQNFTVEVLGGILGLIFGGVVLSFLQMADKTDIWYYPIGLVIGWAIYQIMYYCELGAGIITTVSGTQKASTKKSSTQGSSGGSSNGGPVDKTK